MQRLTLSYTVLSLMCPFPAAGYYQDPSDDVVNAFTAGLLPALERLVREAPAEVEARGEAERGVAEAVLTKCAFDRCDWDQIMPYAGPRELAGLVLAAADVVRGRLALPESSGWVVLHRHRRAEGIRAACTLRGVGFGAA